MTIDRAVHDTIESCDFSHELVKVVRRSIKKHEQTTLWKIDIFFLACKVKLPGPGLDTRRV